jgi:hypothetical protein
MKQEQETEILIGEMKKYLPIPARIKKKPYQYLMQQEGANPSLNRLSDNYLESSEFIF